MSQETIRRRFTRAWPRPYEKVIIEADQLIMDGEPTDRLTKVKVIQKTSQLTDAGAVKIIVNGLRDGSTTFEDIGAPKQLKQLKNKLLR